MHWYSGPAMDKTDPGSTFFWYENAPLFYGLYIGSPKFFLFWIMNTDYRQLLVWRVIASHIGYSGDTRRQNS